MKYFPLKQILFALICWTSIPAVYAADSVVVTESLIGSLKTSRSAGTTYYYVENLGKFSVKAIIAGSSFEEAGIYLADITEDSTIAISIGDFSFSSTLSAADKHTLTATKISANWSQYMLECGKTCKSPKIATISISGNLNGMTLKIDGKSKNLRGFLSGYSAGVFADICDSAGDSSALDEVATLTIDGIPFTATLTGTCSVKTKSVTKGGETYDLITTKLKANKI